MFGVLVVLVAGMLGLVHVSILTSCRDPDNDPNSSLAHSEVVWVGRALWSWVVRAPFPRHETWVYELIDAPPLVNKTWFKAFPLDSLHKGIAHSYRRIAADFAWVICLGYWACAAVMAYHVRRSRLPLHSQYLKHFPLLWSMVCTAAVGWMYLEWSMIPELVLPTCIDYNTTHCNLPGVSDLEDFIQHTFVRVDLAGIWIVLPAAYLIWLETWQEEELWELDQHMLVEPVPLEPGLFLRESRLRRMHPRLRRGARGC
jgi:hypothetical protein